jgi:hypothetical protein
MKSLIKCKNCELYIPRNDDIGYCELRRTTVEKNTLCSLGTSDVVTDGYKHDGGKPRLSLVPPILIRAVGTVMTHGAEKYGEGNWRNVEPERYRDALARHYCEYMEDPYGIDKDSGLPHLYHLACNVAFLLDLEKEKTNDSKND